jgi:hypothetical protein
MNYMFALIAFGEKRKKIECCDHGYMSEVVSVMTWTKRCFRTATF